MDPHEDRENSRPSALSKPGFDMNTEKKYTNRGTEFVLPLSSSMSRTVQKRKIGETKSRPVSLRLDVEV